MNCTDYAALNPKVIVKSAKVVEVISYGPLKGSILTFAWKY
jgi:hypothetical protein